MWAALPRRVEDPWGGLGAVGVSVNLVTNTQIEGGGTVAMESGSGRPRTDKRITRDQKNLIKKLSEYSGDAARSYEGALYAYHSEDNPDRVSHFAYGLMDVIDILASKGSKVDNSKTGQAKTHRLERKGRTKLLVKVLNTHTKQPDYYAECRVLAAIYEQLSEIGHQKIMIDVTKMKLILQKIEKILHTLTEWRTGISDEIAEMVYQSPTKDRTKRLMSMQESEEAYGRITGALPPSWLGHMIDAGYIKAPERNEYQMPHKYLAECAKKYPEKVTDIITSSYDIKMLEKNVPIYIDLISCVRHMPPQYVEDIAHHMLKNEWYRMFWEDEESYIEIVRLLYLEKKYKIASELLYRGLSMPPQCTDGSYIPDTEFARKSLNRLVKEILKWGGREDLLSIFDALANLIDDAVKSKSSKIGDENNAESGMFVNRPTIWDSKKNQTDNMGSYFVKQVRDYLLEIEMKDPKIMQKVMNLIGMREHMIWRRIEMFIYGRFPDKFVKEAENYAIKYIGNKYMEEDNLAMLGKCFNRMSESAIRKIRYKMIEFYGKKPSSKLLKKYGKTNNQNWMFIDHGENFTDDDVSPTGQKHAEARFNDIVEAFGHMSRYMHGNGTPPIHMIRAFSDIVSRYPYLASKMASKLIGVHLDVQVGLIKGLSNAGSDEVEIDWIALIPLMLDIISRVSMDGTKENKRAAWTASKTLRKLFSRADTR